MNMNTNTRTIPKGINNVVFSTLSAKQWMDLAVIEVTESTRMGDTIGTLYDERLGVLENGKICLTCNKNNLGCPGHFGYIILAIPVYNPKLLQAVQRIFKCICFSCSRPRLTEEQMELYGLFRTVADVRLRNIVKKSEHILTCPHCSSPQPAFDVRNGIAFSFDDEEKRPLAGSMAWNILSKITDQDLTLLGFNSTNNEHLKTRPESFIFTVLPVLPPCDRPPIMRNGVRYDDDLTEKYNSILRVNDILKGNKTLTLLEREKYEKDLIMHVHTLIDNHNEKSKTAGGGRAHKGLFDRIVGKSGHVRSNVGGKRTDYSARAVITTGPFLRMGEIGIPHIFAKTLTKPEYVLQWNLTHCQDLVDRDKASIVVRGGQRIRLSIAKRGGQKFVVKPGDIIERHLRDNDLVIFNRQPSIRTESLRAFKIKVLPKGFYSFCFNLSECRSFNADYDGD